MIQEKNSADISLAQGIKEFKKGAYTSAENTLRSAINDYESAQRKNEPISAKNYAAAYKILGFTLNESSKQTEAIKVFKAALTKNIKEFDIYYYLALSQLKTGLNQDAIVSLTEAVKINDKDFPAYYNLGLAYQEVKNPDLAFGAYKKALTLTQDTKEKLDTSYKVIESALAAKKSMLELHAELQEAYKHVEAAKVKNEVIKGSEEAALKDQAIIITQQYYMSCLNTQQDGDKITEISKLYSTLGEKPLSEVILNAMAAMTPSNSDAVSSFLKKLSYLAEYDKDFKSDDKNVVAIKELAVPLIKKYPSCGVDLYKIVHAKSAEELLSALKATSDINTGKNQGYLQFLEGVEKYGAKDYQAALKSFKEASEAFAEIDQKDIPENMKSMTYENLGRIYFAILEQKTLIGKVSSVLKTKAKAKAKAEDDALLSEVASYFKQALVYSNGKNNSEIHNVLGSVYFKQGNYQEAKTSFLKVVEDNKDNFVAYYRLGSTLKELKNFDAAIEAFKKAKTIKSDDFNTLFNLAELLQKSDAHKRAMDEFKQALPKAKDAAEKLSVHCKIIECAQKSPDELKALSKSAYEYVKSVGTLEVTSHSDLVNYIAVNYAISIPTQEANDDHQLQKLLTLTNPSGSTFMKGLSFFKGLVVGETTQSNQNDLHKQDEKKLAGKDDDGKENGFGGGSD